MKKFLFAAVVALGTLTGGMFTTLPIAQAEHCAPSYHWEYRTVWVKVAYTAYGDCGPYTAYKWVKVTRKVKVYDY